MFRGFFSKFSPTLIVNQSLNNSYGGGWRDKYSAIPNVLSGLCTTSNPYDSNLSTHRVNLVENVFFPPFDFMHFVALCGRILLESLFRTRNLQSVPQTMPPQLALHLLSICFKIRKSCDAYAIGFQEFVFSSFCCNTAPNLFHLNHR